MVDKALFEDKGIELNGPERLLVNNLVQFYYCNEKVISGFLQSGSSFKLSMIILGKLNTMLNPDNTIVASGLFGSNHPTVEQILWTKNFIANVIPTKENLESDTYLAGRRRPSTVKTQSICERKKILLEGLQEMLKGKKHTVEA